MVVMFNGPEDRKEPTLEEKSYDVAEFIDEWERKHSPWEIEEEDVQLSPIEQKQGSRSDLQGIATKTMAGILGAITIFGIATGNLNLLLTLAAVAAMFLTRLVHRGAMRNVIRRKKRKSGEPPTDATDDG
jgi:hypothetical protein